MLMEKLVNSKVCSLVNDTVPNVGFLVWTNYLQNVNINGSWVKDKWELSILCLQLSCKSKIAPKIEKKKFKLTNSKNILQSRKQCSFKKLTNSYFKNTFLLLFFGFI